MGRAQRHAPLRRRRDRAPVRRSPGRRRRSSRWTTSERVLLIQQYRHPIRHRDWEIPAGLLDIAGEIAARDRAARARRGSRSHRRAMGAAAERLHDARRKRRGRARLPRTRTLGGRRSARARGRRGRHPHRVDAAGGCRRRGVLAGRLRNGILAARASSPRPRRSRRARHRPPEPREADVRLERAVDAYLRHISIERGLSEHTVAAYRRDLAGYVAVAQRRAASSDSSAVTTALVTDVRRRAGLRRASARGIQPRPAAVLGARVCTGSSRARASTPTIPPGGSPARRPRGGCRRR